MAAATHGILWMATTGIAFVFILQSKVQQHRQWMTRSFVVGPLVFIGVRVLMGLTGFEKLGPAAIETTLWVCLVFSIPLADVMIQWEESSRFRPSQTQHGGSSINAVSNDGFGWFLQHDIEAEQRKRRCCPSATLTLSDLVRVADHSSSVGASLRTGEGRKLGCHTYGLPVLR